MSTSSNVTVQQVVTNFQNAYYCKWDVDKYHEGLEAVQTIWNSGTSTAQASFTAVESELSISVAVDGDSYLASMTNVDNPSGGGASGNMALSGSLQDVINNTKSINYSNASILVVYFLDKNESIIAVYAGGIVGALNPAQGKATGFWT